MTLTIATQQLITRRSRVQIPPPLRKALAGGSSARASTVLCGSSTVPSTGGPGWVLFDELLESAGSFGLHAGEDVLVGVDGECRVGVPQPF